VPAIASTELRSRQRSVLIVDDEPTLRSAISRHLEREGFSVATVESGAQALVQLAAREFDVVLLDLRLPDMPGSEVFRLIELRSPQHSERVIFVTGDLARPSAAQFVQQTGRPVLEKPFVLSDLDRVLRDVIAP
jgi:CheY-like chemotaxis protein